MKKGLNPFLSFSRTWKICPDWTNERTDGWMDSNFHPELSRIWTSFLFRRFCSVLLLFRRTNERKWANRETGLFLMHDLDMKKHSPLQWMTDFSYMYVSLPPSSPPKTCLSIHLHFWVPSFLVGPKNDGSCISTSPIELIQSSLDLTNFLHRFVTGLLTALTLHVKNLFW